MGSFRTRWLIDPNRLGVGSRVAEQYINKTKRQYTESGGTRDNLDKVNTDLLDVHVSSTCSSTAVELLQPLCSVGHSCTYNTTSVAKILEPAKDLACTIVPWLTVITWYLRYLLLLNGKRIMVKNIDQVLERGDQLEGTTIETRLALSTAD